MNRRRMASGWLGLLAGLGLAAPARPDPPASSWPDDLVAQAGPRTRTGLFSARKAWPVSPRFQLDSVAPDYQDRVRAVLERPTLHARGPVETFHCQPELYRWLLDHPDRAVRGWLKMGAKCALIGDRGQGRFGWKDEQGSDVYWDTVVRAPRQRVWYAEGAVRIGPLLPLIPVRAVVILYIQEGHDATGRAAIRHEGELVLHTDSKAAALVARLMGASAPRTAEQYVAQIQTFFAALAWHIDEHPEKAHKLLAE